MRTSLIALVAVLAALLPASLVKSNEVVFEYSGASVVLPGLPVGPFFGHVVPDQSSVSGILAVDTSSPATHQFAANRVGYRQQALDGLRLNVSLAGTELVISASDYLVIITNDLPPQFPGDLESDRVEFVFGTGFSPGLTGFLSVNGNDVSTIDYNRDAIVDSSDFAFWSSGFGASSSDADGNGDQIVNAADYVLWRDGGGAPLGLLSIEFTSFANPFESIDLHDIDLASVLMLGLDDFGSSLNRVNDANSPFPVDFTFNLQTLQVAPSASTLASQPVANETPEPSSLLLATALLIGSAGMRRAKRREER